MAQRVLLTRLFTRQASSQLSAIRPTLSSSLPLTVNRFSDHCCFILSSSSSSSSSRWFHSTPLVQKDDAKAKKKAAKAAAKAKLAAAEADKEEDDDTNESKKEETTKDGEDATKAPAAADANGDEPKKTDEEDDIPEYQNPLHHNNPEYLNENKTYPEDFKEGEEMPVVPLPPMETGDEIPASPELHALADEILQLNILEMNELVTNIADHFGFEDDGAMMGMGGGGGAGGAAAAEEAPKEEKTAFDLKLTGFDAKAKIKVIKEVRAMTGLGLKEAKEMVEGAPKVLKKELKKEEAEELKAKLEAVGATVELA